MAARRVVTIPFWRRKVYTAAALVMSWYVGRFAGRTLAAGHRLIWPDEHEEYNHTCASCGDARKRSLEVED